MGYVVLGILVFVAFGAGFFFGRARVFRMIEAASSDSELSERVAEAVKRNRELLERIRNEREKK